MPELPEIASRAREMDKSLIGKTISTVEILQPKCLNLPVEDFQMALKQARILKVTYRGKWIQVKLSSGWLLINLGMGGDILLSFRDKIPQKYVFRAEFSDGNCLSIRFWWFGYIHFCLPADLKDHKMTAKLGANVLDITQIEFMEKVRTHKGAIKQFLLDQTNFAGIGNAYIHDILFLAKLHPNRKLQSLSDDEISNLYISIHKGLEPSLEKGGAFYEKDIYGNKGGFTMDEIIIGYREGSPCPICSTPIVKIKTGSTSSYICSTCQREG